MQYQIPGTPYLVEVDTLQPPNGEHSPIARTVVRVRDLSKPKPEFNALTYIQDLDHNVIHEEWFSADTSAI